MESAFCNAIHTHEEMLNLSLHSMLGVSFVFGSSRSILRRLVSCPQVFFCKYNDPIYVKMEKLEIMIKLASDRNIDQVLLPITGLDFFEISIILEC